MRRYVLLVAAVFAMAATSIDAQAPTPLPMGTPQPGTATDKPTEYTVAAKTAGVLTVAVQGSGDLMIQVVDSDGQQLQDGSSDRDLNGNEGTELASVTITEAGTYRVRVRAQGSNSNSTYQISGSFLSFPLFARAGDPDGRPGGAKAVQIGRAYEDVLDPSKGDNWDWFVFKATEAGTLTVVTRQSGTGEAPDLILSIYSGGEFGTALDQSDQDLQNNTANESVTLNVTAGQTVHVKVTSNFSSRVSNYRLSSSLAP